MNVWGLLAQVEQPADLPFYERMVSNDTIRNTSVAGWLILLAGIFGGVTLGKIAGAMLRGAGTRLENRGWQMRGIIIRSIAGPANLALIGIGISIGTGQLAPSRQLSLALSKGLAMLYIIALGWLLYNLTDIIAAALKNLTAKTESKLDDQLVPLVTKTLRVFLVAILALFTAENVFGANIGAWLAGLGIAGLAVSLAAQDSIKNVFGSLTILVDQPFAQGDFVKISDKTGSVEEVGFRSTRLRTPDGTLITLPNSDVANSPIENFARRPSIRRVVDVTITYDTPMAKVHEAIAIVKGILSDPGIVDMFDLEKQPPRVFLDALNADSINIKAFYWLKTLDYWVYMAHTEKVNLLILERLAAAGIDLAFPTRTLMLASDPKRPLVVRQQEQKRTELPNM